VDDREALARCGCYDAKALYTATTFELFFDLVYVFAMTQVTCYMVHAHDALGVLQGLLVLALLLWT
jgi:low temperature requirement protein LtrA